MQNILAPKFDELLEFGFQCNHKNILVQIDTLSRIKEIKNDKTLQLYFPTKNSEDNYTYHNIYKEENGRVIKDIEDKYVKMKPYLVIKEIVIPDQVKIKYKGYLYFSYLENKILPMYLTKKQIHNFKVADIPYKLDFTEMLILNKNKYLEKMQSLIDIQNYRDHLEESEVLDALKKISCNEIAESKQYVYYLETIVATFK